MKLIVTVGYLAIALAILFSGRFEIDVGQSGIYKINRITGQIEKCPYSIPTNKKKENCTIIIEKTGLLSYLDNIF